MAVQGVGNCPPALRIAVSVCTTAREGDDDDGFKRRVNQATRPRFLQTHLLSPDCFIFFLLFLYYDSGKHLTSHLAVHLRRISHPALSNHAGDAG